MTPEENLARRIDKLLPRFREFLKDRPDSDESELWSEVTDELEVASDCLKHGKPLPELASIDLVIELQRFVKHVQKSTE